MSIRQQLFVKKLNAEAVLPKKGSKFAAGYDLSASEDSIVPAEGKAIIKTGLAIKTPADTYGRIAPRSGLAVKNHIQVGAGVIDEDYRGEVCVVLFNHSKTDLIVKYHFANTANATASRSSSSRRSSLRTWWRWTPSTAPNETTADSAVQA